MAMEERNPKSSAPTPSPIASKSLHSNYSFNTFSTTLNKEGLKDIREENHVEAFKILMCSQENLVEKSPNSSPIPCSEPSGDFFAELIQQLKEFFFDMDLIQTIKYNPATLYEIKGLLAQLNNS